MYTVHITHTPQSTEPILELDTKTKPAIVEEVAMVRVPTLDIPALMALLYKTPRAKRSDAGKLRGAK